MKTPKSTAAWRDTGKSLKFTFFNARVLAPLVFLIIPPLQGVLTYVFIVLAIALGILDYFKITPMVFFRIVRSKIAGPAKIVRQRWM